jgi:hypothetical protein
MKERLRPDNVVPLNQSADDQKRREINSLRFSWHEKVLSDEGIRRHPNALVFAGHIMHKFNPDRGYAEVSLKGVERERRMLKSSALRARNLLIKRGWLIIREPYTPKLGWSATRYALGGGPQDLLLSEHVDSIDEPSGVCAPMRPAKAQERYR